MAVEEDIVFPLLETVPSESPAIAEVKVEHEVIRRAMGAAEDAILAADRSLFKKVHAELAAELSVHTKHENQLLAYAMESCLGAKRELLIKIARL